MPPLFFYIPLDVNLKTSRITQIIQKTILFQSLEENSIKATPLNYVIIFFHAKLVHVRYFLNEVEILTSFFRILFFVNFHEKYFQVIHLT